jgi:hypothetical protein
MDAARSFKATVQAGTGNQVYVELPFAPAEVWGARDRYHIRGTVNGRQIRGPLDAEGRLVLGAAWRRDNAFAPGDEVSVVLAPEGPQAELLADDIVAALDAEPAARRFFEALPTFYRKGYLSWIDATKRRPEERVARINQMVELLKAGKKERER